jgi:DAK2 domain fusion protein YloV
MCQILQGTGLVEESELADRYPPAGSRGPAGAFGSQHSGGVAIYALDGLRLRDLFMAGMVWLDRHHEIVNALNVFPVPDGDTGTNMLLTMRSAYKEITTESLQSAGEVCRAAAHGALMGARGNSGVILSQILRGFSRSLDGSVTISGPQFAEALAEGSRVAYKGVNRPVEGTILTVVREAAAAAEDAAKADPDLRFIMARTVHAAEEAVANTPKLLPVLAQTGKVDSGGKGLFFILEGMYRALMGETTVVEAAPQVTLEVAPEVRPAKGRRQVPPMVYGFDVQYLVEGQNLDVEGIRSQITGMGDCALVEGDPSLVKVHVHVPNPGVPLSYAVTLGFVSDVVVENMDDMHLPEMPPGYDPFPPRQHAESLAVEGSEAQQSSSALDFTAEPEVIEGPAIVAVVSGLGLARVFRSLGAHYIVPGGQTMNPSTQDLLEAIEKANSSQVIVLPNNANIIMAAQQAGAMATQGKSVAIVSSKTIPQGISALLALNPHADLDRNTHTMTLALSTVQTGEVTIAVHDARFDGIVVHVGDIIGLVNDTLTATGGTSSEVVKQLLDQMDASNTEVITLYHGQPVTAEEARALQQELAGLYPDQEVEMVDGGQPFYHYIISAE